MGTDSVVIFEVILKVLSQMLFVQNDNSIKTFSPNGTDQTFAEWILPRRFRGGQLLLAAHAFYSVLEDRSVDRVSVPQQIFGRGVIGERIDDLLSGPGGRG